MNTLELAREHLKDYPFDLVDLDSQPPLETATIFQDCASEYFADERHTHDNKKWQRACFGVAFINLLEEKKGHNPTCYDVALNAVRQNELVFTQEDYEVWDTTYYPKIMMDQFEADLAMFKNPIFVWERNRHTSDGIVYMILLVAFHMIMDCEEEEFEFNPPDPI